jgi:excinuclease ABC subunit A
MNAYGKLTEEYSVAEQVSENDQLSVYGARVHNLKNIDLNIPRNKLVVFTGLSGSGKSSLAFDTIYAEGQRRYIETFSTYARQFLGNLERPDVDRITGLSPVISIEQKTTSKNPRSTVGTVTEIYDYLRLMYARASDAYSYVTGEKMVKYSEQEITDLIIQKYADGEIVLLAPLVKGRKGHYRELFEQIRKQGFLKVRIDGEFREITFGLQLDRYKIHDIEIVVDTIFIESSEKYRLSESVNLALRHGKGILMVLEKKSGKVFQYSKHLMCSSSGISYQEPEPNSFSFNSPYGACHKCNGLGTITELDIDKIIPDRKKSIKKGAIVPLDDSKNKWIYGLLEAIGIKYDFKLDTPIEDFSDEALNIILYGTDEIFKVKNENLGVSSAYSLNFEGVASFINNQYQEANSSSLKKWAFGFMNDVICPECNGTRLKNESLFFKIAGKNIAELAAMDIRRLYEWISDLPGIVNEKTLKIAGELIKEIKKRLEYLLNIGLDYLMLNRPAKTLSGGEAQRIRLATQIGTNLVGVLYILDEPSIGLHQRDNSSLIETLFKLRDAGNSVIVVEHDKEMILAADYIFDIGPGAGELGGYIVAQGTPTEFKAQDSITARYLNNKCRIEMLVKKRSGNGKTIKLKGATGHNLKNVDLTLPLGTFICVTGVSGSGKSSLINDTLFPILNTHFFRAETKPLPYKEIKGVENIDKVIDINQSPIGRSPRSNPGTYVGVFDEIRKLFAQLPESKVRGYLPGRFSFNVKGGRCETCQGAGVKTIEMNFLPDVYVECDVCGGKRYNRETLEVRFKGKSINDVLNMSIDQAIEFFQNIPSILNKIKAIHDVGLGYIRIGQQSTTLSGGEAQRVKLAAELSRKDTGNTLYILDEPTTGLHFEDIRILLDVLHKLVNKGNTVIVIEHNMDVIKVADYVIDLGPEGGERGGYILCQGTPEEIAEATNSYTGKYLKKTFMEYQ